jgi:hypothetical protein
VPHFTTERKAWHLLNWAAEWNETGQGRSMWAYSLDLGGSHALLNGWYRSAKVMIILSLEERGYVDAARERARQSQRARSPKVLSR